LKLCCDWRHHKEPVGYISQFAVKIPFFYRHVSRRLAACTAVGDCPYWDVSDLPSPLCLLRGIISYCGPKRRTRFSIHVQSFRICTCSVYQVFGKWLFTANIIARKLGTGPDNKMALTGNGWRAQSAMSSSMRMGISSLGTHWSTWLDKHISVPVLHPILGYC
jgi:hypothetical protein